MKKYVYEEMLESLLSTKKDITTFITDCESNLILKDNTEYRLTDVSSLMLSYPEDNFEVWMRISLSQTGTISIVFPAETKYIGSAPTFGNGQTWEISIKDGVVVCWRVE